MRHGEVKEGLKGWATDKARQAATGIGAKVSKSAKVKSGIEQEYNSLLDDLKADAGKLKGKLTVGKFTAWLEKKGYSSSSIQDGFKEAGFQLVQEKVWDKVPTKTGQTEDTSVNPETVMNWDTVRLVLRSVVGSENEKSAGFSNKIPNGTEFKIRGRHFKWSGNQWVEAKGEDELGYPDFSHSGNVNKKLQAQITDIYRQRQGEDVPGNIQKAEPTAAPKAKEVPDAAAPTANATTAAMLIDQLNNLPKDEKEKFTQAFLNAMGARGR